ncbi:unnamed protein product [Microthlaspi erraticum]|uniref:Reverse transcriptase domain-containing protein n=1 Tax=Microthlaspi erraticum TaxID=1685480 RepID=A0A6D2JIQ7_9BRAS|nr:unnamed protein product [Microthlaspi erraticum]
MPFLDACMLIPPYQKFLKDAVTERRKEVQGMVVLSQECSAIITRKVVGKKRVCDATTVAKRLGFEKYQKCDVSLVLADRSVRIPVGSADLGKALFGNRGAIIDVQRGKIELNFGDDFKLSFDIKRSMKKPTIDGQLFWVETLDQLADEYLEELATEDQLQLTLTEKAEEKSYFNTESLETLREIEEVHKVEAEHDLEQLSDDDWSELKAPKVDLKTLPDGLRTLSEIEEVHKVEAEHNLEQLSDDDWSELKAPKVDLKTLPDGLRYAFLGPNSTYPVIVNQELTPPQLTSLLNELRKFRRAIGSIEHQRRLNPNLKEVVKKEILKLLDAGVIYPISDSTWVSPVHCVPKKGGITVVKNEKNEMIPTRTITGHRMCIDYRKLNAATRKDHFPLPFIDQMLERLANHPFYCFLDGYSGFFQIPIHPNDQEKTPSHVPMELLPINVCPLDCVTLRRLSKGA